MKILLISPTNIAITPTSRYTGIERLVYEYSKVLCQEQSVSIISHPDSVFPESVTHFKATSELEAHLLYSGKYSQFDVIHDFSHLHLASRYMANLPSLNIFWHAPAVARFPKAPYNIVAPSEWAAREFRRVYKQKAVYQQVIAIDKEIYHYNPNLHRSDRLLSLGKITPRKGHLEAIALCLELKHPLDIVGAIDTEDDYVKQVKGLCDGSLIRYHGEVDEWEKIRLMQTCKALIYVAQEPEVTAHKVQECLMCGTPVIVADIGSNSEWIENGVDGYRCMGKQGFVDAISKITKLDDKEIAKRALKVYDSVNVVKNWYSLYSMVAKGIRW